MPFGGDGHGISRDAGTHEAVEELPGHMMWVVWHSGEAGIYASGATSPVLRIQMASFTLGECAISATTYLSSSEPPTTAIAGSTLASGKRIVSPMSM